MATKKNGVAWVALAGFIGTVVLANVLTTHYGFIPVGFGYMATAGTLVVGVTLVMRDLVQDGLGRRWVLVAIVAGAAISFAMSAPFIALASVAAFLVSELVDFAIYTPMRKRSKFGDKRWTLAVVLSNLAGAILDTVIFLWIAFGAAAIIPALPGQLVGKAWATLMFLAIGWVVRGAVLRKSLNPQSS